MLHLKLDIGKILDTGLPWPYIDNELLQQFISINFNPEIYTKIFLFDSLDIFTYVDIFV